MYEPFFRRLWIFVIFFTFLLLSFSLPAIAADTSGPMANVHSWLYLINQGLTEETVHSIELSGYDLIVLDYTPSTVGSSSYPMADIIRRFHNAGHPKIVVAYIDIGEAEEYRTYWQQGWGIGNPDWIVASDPDGWEGNFPVAFWRRDWKNIWLADDGMLAGIINVGFDGVYLDWIEAYSDENISAAAREDEIEPRAAMIQWIGEIASYGRARNRNFLVIAQNAPELLQDSMYINTIDGIAEEQIWFDGGADNKPPGDCPLPRTDADVDTAAYVDGLSEECKAQYEAYPDSTLHTSSEEYLDLLAVAGQHHLPVLTVDYAVQPENVNWIYKTSRALGFVPFVSNRNLDTYYADEGIRRGGPLRNDTAELLVSALPQSVQNPAFSPDGTSILYTLFHEGYNMGPTSLAVCAADGGHNSVLLAEEGVDSVNLPGASWNKTNNRIAFASDRLGPDDIWTMNHEGADLQQVTSHTEPGYYTEPSFSPDGSRLVFEADTDEQNDDRQQGSIVTVGADGSGLKKLTDGPAGGTDDRQPNWSPAGDRILFQRRLPASDNWDIYTMRPDGSDLKNVTNSPSSDTDASFSPDGKWIVYSSDYGGLPMPNIFIIPTAGGVPLRVTRSNDNEDGAPSWSPDGRWLTFESHPGQDEDTPAGIYRIKLTMPVPAISGLRGEGTMQISSGEHFSLFLSLQTGIADGYAADWWLVAVDPAGNLLHYNLTSQSFVMGLAPSYQGILSSFDDYPVNNITFSEPGLYQVYFGIDLVKNGALDSRQLFYGMQPVMVQ